MFSYQNKLLIRRFIIRKDGVVLRAEDKDVADIFLNKKDEFYIVGKIVGTVEENVEKDESVEN